SVGKGEGQGLKVDDVAGHEFAVGIVPPERPPAKQRSSRIDAFDQQARMEPPVMPGAAVVVFTPHTERESAPVVALGGRDMLRESAEVKRRIEADDRASIATAVAVVEKAGLEPFRRRDELEPGRETRRRVGRVAGRIPTKAGETSRIAE